MIHKGIRSKRLRKEIPVPTWTCTYCGHVHTPATLLRKNNDFLICASCGKDYPSVKVDLRGSDNL